MNRLLGYTREVLVQRVALVAAITAVLHLAVALHWVSQDWSDSAVRGVTAALDGLGLIVATYLGRKVVTPTVDPRNDAGDRLISVVDHDAAVTAARADAAAGALEGDTQDVDWPATGATPADHVPEHAAPEPQA